MRKTVYGTELSLLNTPALILDLDAFDRNVAKMARQSRERGFALRPHAKSHKSSAIARMQVDAGAVGVCCATIGEAEAMAAGGVADLLITSPLVTDEKIARLVRLITRGCNACVVVDNSAVVARLDTAAQQASIVIPVMVDLDVGHHRTGVISPTDAAALAVKIKQAAGLRMCGMQAYAGHVQHIGALAERAKAAEAVQVQVKAARRAIENAGVGVDVVSGEGTGTSALSSGNNAFTELQAGSYIFMDAEYLALEFDGGAPFEPSLTVLTTVVSANVPGQVSTDAGTKSFATNGPSPIIRDASLRGARYSFAGDEHGRVVLAPDMQAPVVGTKIECIVSHCDPTVALFPAYHAVRGGSVEQTIPIDGRGQ
ncbi:MAG TPA: DSD1 family PLP-dependent enzyme [Bauldia sp.]|nr:DSD1 family PLP-dependent enzyme [Bauldia sp.]